LRGKTYDGQSQPAQNPFLDVKNVENVIHVDRLHAGRNADSEGGGDEERD
jgi:hypothetical protein